MKKRVLQVPLAIALVYVSMPVVAFPQPVAAGPSIKETEAWIKRELPAMGSYSVVRVKNDDRSKPSTTNHRIESAVLSDCRLSIRRKEDTGEFLRLTYTETVTLKDVDVRRVRDFEQPVATGYTYDRPRYRVVLSVAAGRGQPFTSQMKQDNFPAGEIKPIRVVGVGVRDAESANRVANAFRNAAVLCGAPIEPITTALASAEGMLRSTQSVAGRYVRQGRSSDFLNLNPDGMFSLREGGKSFDGTYAIQADTITLKFPKGQARGYMTGSTILDTDFIAWEKEVEQQEATAALQQKPSQAVQSPPSKPESPATSKMTNDEVIQLVAAGLSEQVVTTSIRQAPAKNFDLTPTGLIALKKAGVTDAVIVVMQERAAPVQAAAVTPVAAPPKYDANLAAPPPKPVAAPAHQDGCSGVESMGLYKNEIFDRAMGGGVVEWLAKIRNNTGVTKIVVFGWRDMYGQQQRSQVQIRGGEIASPRLDMTQARVIPPVTDVRVLSCQ